MAKPAIRWKAVAQDSALAGRTIYVPMVVDRTEPIDLTTLIERAIDTGRIAGLKPSAAQSIAEGTCEMIAQVLREGEGVQFGEYFCVRMYLGGTVDGPLSSLTDKNPINAKIITGDKLKIDRSQFSFRNINNTDGGAPYLDEVQSDVDGAVNAVVEIGRGLAFIGSNLALGEGDAIVAKKRGEDGDTVVGTIRAADCTTSSNKLVRCPWDALGAEGLQAGDVLYFEVVKRVEIAGGQTATQASNRFAATVAEAAPAPVQTARLVAAMSASGMHPGVIEPNSDVMIVGEGVKLAGNDVVKAAWYPAADAAAPTSTAEISVASLVGTDDTYVKFHWGALSSMGGLASGYVRFSVVKGGRESNAIDASISEE